MTATPVSIDAGWLRAFDEPQTIYAAHIGRPGRLASSRTTAERRSLDTGKAGFPGGWRTVPAATAIFEWRKVIARPSLSPGLTNWCFLAQDPRTGEILLSYDEITDPTGKYRKDPPRYDFSGLRRRQIFLRSRDRGESWERVSDHFAENSPGAWQLNGRWEKMSFLPDGKLLAFGLEHTEGGRRPMLSYRLSSDSAGNWTEWRAVTSDPTRGIFSGDFCRMQDGRWIHFHDVYDAAGPTTRSRIRRIRWYI
jgi:hypothetical protein